MADKIVPSTLTDLEWIRSLGARLWLPGSHRQRGRRNGFRDPKLRITRAELERVRSIVREHHLPCEILRTVFGSELAVYAMERGGKREVLRLTHHHIPSHSYNPNHRREIAARVFAGFAEEPEAQNPKPQPPN